MTTDTETEKHEELEDAEDQTPQSVLIEVPTVVCELKGLI